MSNQPLHNRVVLADTAGNRVATGPMKHGNPPVYITHNGKAYRLESKMGIDKYLYREEFSVFTLPIADMLLHTDNYEISKQPYWRRPTLPEGSTFHV